MSNIEDPDWANEEFSSAGLGVFAGMLMILKELNLLDELETNDFENLMDTCYEFVVFVQSISGVKEIEELNEIWRKS